MGEVTVRTEQVTSIASTRKGRECVMAIGTMRLTIRDGVVINQGDDIGDDLAGMSPAERELRAETVGILLRLFKRKGEFHCTKVRPRGSAKLAVGGFDKVSGYVTFLKDIEGKTPQEMEPMFGYKPGEFSGGAEVLLVEEELTPDRIAPRYNTLWPAGVSPRDLDRVGGSYDPRYPPAKTPIFQCVIYRNKPATARLIASLNYGQVFRRA